MIKKVRAQLRAERRVSCSAELELPAPLRL